MITQVAWPSPSLLRNCEKKAAGIWLFQVVSQSGYFLFDQSVFGGIGFDPAPDIYCIHKETGIWFVWSLLLCWSCKVCTEITKMLKKLFYNRLGEFFASFFSWYELVLIYCVTCPLPNAQFLQVLPNGVTYRPYHAYYRPGTWLTKSEFWYTFLFSWITIYDLPVKNKTPWMAKLYWVQRNIYQTN